GVTEIAHMQVPTELLAQIIAGKNERASGVLFFAKTKEVCRVADLSFDLLLAITEIVISDQRDHNAAFVTTSHLEGEAVVVPFIRVTPAHAISPMALGGLVPVGKADRFLSHACQVRRQDHATGVA